jgi:ubiquinone/menaquinone biosynthesis C-methylase UbiE
VKALQEILRSVPVAPCIEIGIGSGRFAQRLNIQYGLDPAIEQLEIANKRNIIVLQGIGELLPFKDGYFRTVFMIATLCFVKSVLKVFSEATRILKNDGHLILGTIPAKGRWGRLYEKKRQADHPFYKNATFYDFNQLEASLKAAGFSIINVMSTLMQQPDKVNVVETPKHGFIEDSGFIAIHAMKL